MSSENNDDETMSGPEQEYVASLIAQEGFEYALRHKTTFSNINDSKFQKLLKDFCDAADAIENYIGEVEEY